METSHIIAHRRLPLASQPAESGATDPGLAGTFGPLSPGNLPLLIIAALLIVLVIVAVFFIVRQLRRSSAPTGKSGNAERIAPEPGAITRNTVGSGAHRTAGSSFGAGSAAGFGDGSLHQFRDALIQAEAALAQAGNSGDGIVHCWLALERGAQRAGFKGKPGASSTESTQAFLHGLHPNRGDVQTLLRLYHWASKGVTEHQRRISPAELGAAKEALAALRLSIDARLAAAARR